MTYKRTAQSTEKFLMKFGILRRKAERNLSPLGIGFPDLYATFYVFGRLN